jgi:hypothetical protein
VILEKDIFSTVIIISGVVCSDEFEENSHVGTVRRHPLTYLNAVLPVTPRSPPHPFQSSSNNLIACGPHGFGRSSDARFAVKLPLR